jgi:hypothetical protein
MTLTKEQERAVEERRDRSGSRRQRGVRHRPKGHFRPRENVPYDDRELTDDELHAIAARTLDDLDTAEPIP